MNSASGTAEKARSYFGGSWLAINYSSYCSVGRKRIKLVLWTVNLKADFCISHILKGNSELRDFVLVAVLLSGIRTCDAEVIDRTKVMTCCGHLFQALTSATAPVTVPLKTAVAEIHCPSGSLAARMSAHRILYNKQAQEQTDTQDERITPFAVLHFATRLWDVYLQYFLISLVNLHNTPI